VITVSINARFFIINQLDLGRTRNLNMADYPISNVPRRVQYVNTGVGPYLFNFEILTQTDIAVYRGSTLLTLTTDYSVTINSNGTGSITLVTAGTGNITIVGARAIQRTSDYTTNGDLFANTLNVDLDSQTIYSQQIAETADRSVKVPPYAASTTGLTVNPEANKLLGWDSTGTNLINIDSSTLATIATYATAYADVFVSNGSTVVYTLTRNPGSIYNLDVSIDGVTQEPIRDYTLSGSTITFTSTIPNLSRILIKYKEGLPNVTADSQDIRYLPAGTSTATNVQAKLRETVSVKDFGAVGDGVTDDTAAIQAAVDYAISISQSASYRIFSQDGGTSSNGYASVYFPMGVYKIAQANGVVIPAPMVTNRQACIAFDAEQGAVVIGNGGPIVAGTNIGFNFTGGAKKNIFRKLMFGYFGTAISFNSSNTNFGELLVESCESANNVTFIDTVAFASSRSTLVNIHDTYCFDTEVFIKHYTDVMNIKNCWIYAKRDSLTAPFYLSGDGNVTIENTFFIPHGIQTTPINNSRWIDMVCDSTQSVAAERSLRFLNIKGCRISSESTRPFIWFYDNLTGPAETSITGGYLKLPSITIEDSFYAGNGRPLVTYIQGYPGSVNFRNVKGGLVSDGLVSANASGTYGGVPNTTYPVPSVPGTLTYHAITIDEATRLGFSNIFNAQAKKLVDPLLEAFLYDSTSQTSKFKRSIYENIDYRLVGETAPGAGTGFVKVTLPIYFDNTHTVPNRDILSFILVTVSDANGEVANKKYYRSQATTLVTIVGGDNGGTPTRRIVTTTLQDGQGGATLSASAVPSVFWGSGDTGSADIDPTTAPGTATRITATWFGRYTDENRKFAWAYIIPLSGMRDNYAWAQQQDLW